MTKIKATVYKNTGKFYTENTIESDKSIHLFEKESFIKLLADNGVPFIEDGFVVTTDLDDGEGFHNHLFQCNELTEYIKK